ncbi:MAG: tRNA preQ1(34) S-adenosylmethionine ribosyltransferase-isomerase QueA [Methyloligellaceae bacterium]
MRVDDFDFELPQERIALRPVRPGDDARLLQVQSESSEFTDHQVKDLTSLLRKGDVLVFNNTKVIPARLTGVRIGRGDTTPKIEVTLHKRVTGTDWLAFAKPGKKMAEGDIIAFGADRMFQATVTSKGEAGEISLAFHVSENGFEADLAEVGYMPLPPYIASKRAPDASDLEDYQTMFAKEPGAVAAPTAGLHFTDRLIDELAGKGVGTELVTLHVGAGTFLPVKVDDLADHKMHAEWGEVSAETAERLNKVRRDGGRLVAVGTTSLRLLESATGEDRIIRPFSGDTDIFITPGYKFRAIDLLMTNFHLPKSTLFMLVSAFCGIDVMQAAYKYAIENKYRFYSYGDASLLHPAEQLK